MSKIQSKEYDYPQLEIELDKLIFDKSDDETEYTSREFFKECFNELYEKPFQYFNNRINETSYEDNKAEIEIYLNEEFREDGSMEVVMSMIKDLMGCTIRYKEEHRIGLIEVREEEYLYYVVINKIKYIVCGNGIYQEKLYKKENKNSELLPIMRNEVASANQFIEKYCEKASNDKKTYGSYGIKHEAERKLNTYISNGAMITALLINEYSFDRYYFSINLDFKLKYNY